jgi:DNA-directed RNA polymerase specialized sigma24 family protein
MLTDLDSLYKECRSTYKSLYRKNAAAASHREDLIQEAVIKVYEMSKSRKEIENPAYRYAVEKDAMRKYLRRLGYSRESSYRKEESLDGKVYE